MKESKQTVILNESQLKTLIKKILNETMQDQVPGMPRFNSREEYNQWRQQQKALTKGMDDDEYDKTTYGQFEKAKTDRYWNKIANLDGKKVYQPVGDDGLTFNDFKDRQQKGKTNDGVYRNFVQKHTQTMPNGGKKWVQNVAESQLNQIIKESIKKILKEGYEDYYNDAKDLYFKLDDPYNAEELLRQIQSDLEQNFINIDGVFDLEPVNEKNYEYKIPNLSYDEYEDIYNFLSDKYHDELWIEEQ